MQVFDLFLYNIVLVTVCPVLRLFVKTVVELQNLFFHLCDILIDYSMHLGLQLLNRLLFKFGSLILIAFGLLIMEQIDSVVVLFRLEHLVPKFKIAGKLVRVFAGEVLYFLALYFDVAHEAVEDDEVEFVFLAFHVVEHDIVAFIQIEYALLSYVDVSLFGLFNQED